MSGWRKFQGMRRARRLQPAEMFDAPIFGATYTYMEDVA
jgi:hypothetical protein